MHQTSNEFAPASQGELQRFVQENDSGERLALYPVGGRTSLNFGRAATRPGTLVSLANLTQTVDYPVRDMTITIEAGIRMDELAALLREQGQQLPIDVAQSNRATLGGVVAINAAGPRRYGLGTMRDYVIGLTAIDAAGRQFHSGGRVVKNVAGYDLCKLMVGSLGSLAIITQLTLKLKPLPESTVLLWTSFNAFAEIDSALNDLQQSSARPVVLDVLNSSAAKQVSAEARQDLPCDGPVLIIGLEGTARETAWQVEKLKDELQQNQPGEIAVTGDESATRLLQALTEFPTASDAPLTFQAGMLPSKTLQFIEQATSQNIAVQSHAGDGLVIGHLPDKASTIEQVSGLLKPLRELACSGRGNLVVLNCDAGWAQDLPTMGEPEPGWPLMQQLKTSLDPHNILNPGRFVFCEST